MATFGGWRLTQTGIVFIVGILILGGLVTGGIFLVKNHGEAVRRDQAVKIAEQSLEDQSKIAAQQNKSTEPDSESINSTGTPAEESKPSVSPSGSQSAVLPETGFDDTNVIERTAIIAILALSIAYYVSSRRALNTL